MRCTKEWKEKAQAVRKYTLTVCRNRTKHDRTLYIAIAACRHSQVFSASVVLDYALD